MSQDFTTVVRLEVYAGLSSWRNNKTPRVRSRDSILWVSVRTLGYFSFPPVRPVIVCVCVRTKCSDCFYLLKLIKIFNPDSP